MTQGKLARAPLKVSDLNRQHSVMALAVVVLFMSCVAPAAEPADPAVLTEASHPAPDWQPLKPYGGKVILIDFWASWCAPCRRSFPWMNELQQRFEQSGLVIIAVNVDQDRALADAFLRQVPGRFQLEFDATGGVAEQFQVRGMPTSFLIDRRGRIRAHHAGFRDSQIAAREQLIQQLLQESAP